MEPYWQSEDGRHTVYCGDCMEVLPTLGGVVNVAGEKIAIVTDPPYGIGETNLRNLSRARGGHATDYGDFSWDKYPLPYATIESVLQYARDAIIFGGNFYPLPPASCWLIWDKLNSGDFADCEMAWTNLKRATRIFRYLWNGMIKARGETRGDHPTQKPVGVMLWCLSFLPKAHIILDPFMGSGTTGVACIRTGRRFIGIEIDEAYCARAVRRLEVELQQLLLLTPVPVSAPAPRQERLL